MRTCPPWVCPESVRETRGGTRGKMSGSCASRMTGASSVTLASVPSRSCTPSKLRRPTLLRRRSKKAIWSPRPARETGRPVGRGDAIARNLQPPHRLDGQAIARQAHHAGAGETQRLEEPAARDAFHVCDALNGVIPGLVPGTQPSTFAQGLPAISTAALGVRRTLDPGDEHRDDNCGEVSFIFSPC